MPSIQVRPPTSYSIRTAPGGVVNAGGGAGATVSNTTPSNPNQGDLWFNSSVNLLNVYDGSQWDKLGLVDYDNDGRFEYEATTSGSTLSSGVLASFSNNGNLQFQITYDGVVGLKEQGSEPTALTGGLYHDGDNLYIGVNT